MQFGFFDDKNREYVITTPKTPYPWINYLGSENFFALVSHRAGGYCFYRDARLRRWTGLIAALIVAMLAVAFVRSARVPPRPPAEPLAADSSAVWIEAAALADGHPHFYELTADGATRRFFAIEVGGEVRTCLDACEICGDRGYFEDRGTMVCRNCTSPIATATLGRTGGCNPIPVPHQIDAGRIRIRAADLAAGYARIRGD